MRLRLRDGELAAEPGGLGLQRSVVFLKKAKSAGSRQGMPPSRPMTLFWSTAAINEIEAFTLKKDRQSVRGIDIR